MDIEEYHYVDQTLDLYEELRSEFSNVGLCLQSYLLRAQYDLDRILEQPLVERMELVYEIGESQPIAFAVRTLCDHVSQRLEGRERSVAEFELRLGAAL